MQRNPKTVFGCPVQRQMTVISVMVAPGSKQDVTIL